MKWILAEHSLPNQIYGANRFLVMVDCHHKAHKAMAFDWPYPCGEVNIAYFWNGKWRFSTGQELLEGTFVTHWMLLPERPGEE